MGGADDESAGGGERGEDSKRNEGLGCKSGFDDEEEHKCESPGEK